MKVINDTIFLATAGGLLVNDYNNTNSPGLEFTNVDGLGTVDITDVIVDSSGQKWVTGMGRILKFNYSSSIPFLFFDQNNNLIKCHTAADDGDFLWVGTEVGLVLFSKINDGGQIEDSYTLFDSLNASPEVFDICLDGDTIWIATSAGLARADKLNPNLLKSPSFWKTYDRARYAELGSDNFSRIVKFENTFYAATSSGLYNLDRTSADSFLVIPLGQSSLFTDLKINNDSLFFYSTTHYGVIKNSDTAQLSFFGMPSRPTTGVSNGVFRWGNVRNTGVYQNSGGAYQVYPYTGTPGSSVNDLTVNKDGSIYAGFETIGGEFKNGQWNTFSLVLPNTLVDLAPSGDVFMGTYGHGLWKIDAASQTNYDETNSPMTGNNDAPPVSYSYIVNFGLETDNRFLYSVCYRSYTGNPLVIGDLNNLNNLTGWVSMDSAQGINTDRITSLDVFGTNVALGTEGIGVYDCYIGPNPLDLSDVQCQLLNTANSFLISNAVRTVKYSPTGEIWAGTNFGLSRYDFGFERFVDVPLPAGIGPDIKVLEFDTRGNVWLGSENGLVFLDRIEGTSEFFNSQNSGLVSNAVINIHYDVFTGKLYVATNAGISIISSTIGKPTAEVQTVVAFPNPYVIDSPDDEVEFNFSRNGIIRLYSMAGELIREIPVGQRWNGKNESGQDVVSGVYIYVITDDNGNVGRGKILLIRK